VGIAELDLHLGAARDDARGIRVEQHAAERPYRARPGDLGEAVVDARGESHHRSAGIATARHLRRAGVVLLAGDRDPVVPIADDRLDDADLEPGRVEPIALLDMRFEIAHIALRIEPLAWPAGKPGLGERGAQQHAVAAAPGLDLALRQCVGEGPAAEHIAEMAFLVGPGDRLDAEPGESWSRGDGARQFERVDDAERAVEPAAMRLGLAVRADEQAS